MSLLAAHLEQIALSCEGIDSLPFPPPKIFTNALLANHDITSLIRDTEAHERALFSVPPPPPPPTAKPEPKATSARRQTVFNVASGEVTAGPPTSRGNHPRRNTAVAAVLGGDLHEQLRRNELSSGVTGGKGELDVEVLLHGAEKLCGVYALPGALERIPAIRAKHTHHANTLAYYEAKVAEQSLALEALNKDHWMDDGEDEDEVPETGILTAEELRAEEEEVRQLERKKRELQERLKSMERDLGGLLNM